MTNCTVSKPRTSIKENKQMFALVGGPEVVRDYEDWGYTEDGARRLAACWNACSGVDVIDLELDNVKFVEALKERSTLKAQRDTLLKHLTSLAQAVELYATNGTDWPELIAANKLIEELGGK